MSLIPTEALLWAIHGIVLFGIVVFISSYFAGPYKILVTPFALVIILFGVFYEGNYYGTKDYRDKVAEIETKVEEVKVESEKVNTVIQTKYVDRVKNILDNYLGKNTRVSEKDLGNGSKQVCDLDSGECYTVRMKDGLIERVDNTMNQSKKIAFALKS